MSPSAATRGERLSLKAAEKQQAVDGWRENEVSYRFIPFIQWLSYVPISEHNLRLQLPPRNFLVDGGFTTEQASLWMWITVRLSTI